MKIISGIFTGMCSIYVIKALLTRFFRKLSNDEIRSTLVIFALGIICATWFMVTCMI